LRLNIFAAISCGLCCCAFLGFSLARLLESVQSYYAPALIFWSSGVVILVLGLLIQHLMPPCEEPAHRTLAPLWIKLPTIAAVILFLILIKKELGGFITAFPMVGVVAAYEARRSLWTMSRQASMLLPALAVMMIAAHLAQSALGWSLPLALAAGWVVYLPLVIACTPVVRDRIINCQKRTTDDALVSAD
ncbi:MAG TPA: hypothetical protein VEF04_19610, partial [Blastocatellia bacterium]|nr:hypothetical protein [Blastocatellia bacterium]